MPLTSTESWKGADGTPAPHLCFRSSPLTTALQRLSNNDTGSRSWDSPDPQCAWLHRWNLWTSSARKASPSNRMLPSVPRMDTSFWCLHLTKMRVLAAQR